MPRRKVTASWCWLATKPITAASASRRFRRDARPCRDLLTIPVCSLPNWLTTRFQMCPDRSARTGAWRDSCFSPLPASGERERRLLDLQLRTRTHTDPRQQHHVLGVRDRIADILIQQIVADDTDDHLAGSEIGWIQFGLVADFRLQEIVAGGRRFADHRDIVLCKRMQQVDACQPIGVTPEHASADAHRGNPRNVGAIGEGSANDIELILNAPSTAK